jgi:hypothetical protein
MASYPAEPKGSRAADAPEAKFDDPASIHSHPMHPDDDVRPRTVQCTEPGCPLRAVPGGGHLCSRHRPRQPKNPRPRNLCTHPGCTRPQAFVGPTCTRHRPARLAPPAGHHRGPAAHLEDAYERLRNARRFSVRQPGLAQTDPPRRHASDVAEHLRILGMAEHQERDNDRSWQLENRRRPTSRRIRKASSPDAGGGAADAEPPVLVGAMHRQGHPSLPDEEGSQLERTDNKPKDKKGKKGGTKKRRSKGKRRTRKRRSKRRRRTRR